ncbi:hypothetical protein ACFW04_012229 [Cataglyphis niger]
MKAIIELNCQITVREIAEWLNVSHTIIENYIRCLGLVKKLDIWISHELKEIHLTQRIIICDTHFKQKIMLSIWYDYKSVVYFELLPNNQFRSIKEKRPELANRKGIVFHHDNARSHTSLATRTKLLELGWEVISQLPYSPNLAPLDYHLFRSTKLFK